MENRWDNAEVHYPPDMGRDERLNMAEVLLVGVRATLTTSLPTCGTDHKEDWDEYMAGEALDAAVTRIKKAKHLLDVSVEKRRLNATDLALLKAARASEE